jgi:hypothetical protein
VAPGGLCDELLRAWQAGRISSQRLLQQTEGRPRLRTIVVSGGGNDLTHCEFSELLHPPTSGRRGLDLAQIRRVVDGTLENAYDTFLAALTSTFEEQCFERPRILIHGFAHSVPEVLDLWGGWGFLPGAWLRRGFERAGYTDAREMQEILNGLLGRLHAMQKRVAGRCGHVSYIDMRRVVAAERALARYWDNSLSPHGDRFVAIGCRSFKDQPIGAA